jgi:hypothetical protein
MASVVIRSAGHGSRVLKGGAHDLGRVDDALLDHVAILAVWALKPKLSDLFSSTLPTTIEPSTPAFSTIWRIGAWMARRTMAMPAVWSALSPFRP